MANPFPRCVVVPEADHQVALIADGVERVRWHHGPQYPRPFFYPLRGPSGKSLTRMGHPGAPDHDHHRSIWFAHNKVLGIDFWADGGAARVRQNRWLSYVDGDDECLMAVELGWYDGHDPKELIRQELVAAVRPGANGETFFELQATFRPAAAQLELPQTNFGFLAVRVAKSLSARYGGGKLTGADGKTGEPQLFGKPNPWMDYSGPIQPGTVEGVTLFDHPTNPGSPAHWHVRDDGWMGPSVCRLGPVLLTQEKPLVLRYLLHAHAGDVNASRTAALLREFADRPGFMVLKQKGGAYQFIASRTR